jgi:hypothetical protein
MELRDNYLGKAPLKRHVKVVILLLLIMNSIFLGASLTSTSKVSAETYEIGVKVGDWAKYIFSFNWSSTRSEPEPPEVNQTRQVVYSIFNVTEISGWNITVQETIYFKNGSQTTTIYFGDIRTGKPSLGFQIIAKNLKEGDKIWEPEDAPKVEKTGHAIYAGATRTINFISTDMGDPEGNITITYFFWDQATGFLCEMSFFNHYVFGDYNNTSLIKWLMIETSLWTPEVFTFPAWSVPIILVSVACIVYFVRRKSSRKRLKKR